MGRQTKACRLLLKCLAFCRAEVFNQEVWNSYVELANMPPLEPMLSLYNELKALNWSFAVLCGRVEAERNITIQNLNEAGYEDFTLILRSVDPTHTIPLNELHSCKLCDSQFARAR